VPPRPGNARQLPLLSAAESLIRQHDLAALTAGIEERQRFATRFAKARAHLEQAIALYDPAEDFLI
jgi:hypothetical protein